MEEEIKKHKRKLIQKINEFKVHTSSIDTWFIPNLYEAMLKRKGNRGMVFDKSKYNINDDVNTHDALEDDEL